MRSPGVLVEHVAPVAVDLVHAVLGPVGRASPGSSSLGSRPPRVARRPCCRPRRGRVVGQAVGLDHAVGDVDAEAVDAAVEPEAQDVAELLAHLVVGPVEVGLRAVEEVQVPLAGRAVGLGRRGSRRGRRRRTPSCSAAGRRRRRGRRGTGSGRARRCRARRRAPPGTTTCSSDEWLGTRSTMTRMPQRVRLGEHRVEVGERAEERVDVAVVGDVVAGVASGARCRRARARWRRCRARRGRPRRAVMPARSPMPSPFASANDRG